MHLAAVRAVSRPHVSNVSVRKYLKKKRATFRVSVVRGWKKSRQFEISAEIMDFDQDDFRSRSKRKVQEDRIVRN